MQNLKDKKKFSPHPYGMVRPTHTGNPTTSWNYMLDSKEENLPRTGKL